VSSLASIQREASRFPGTPLTGSFSPDKSSHSHTVQ
jgi:hypothetical protein